MMRAIRVLLAACLFIGCSSDHASPAETVIQTEGNKEEALFALRYVAWLDQALQAHDLDEVQRLAFAIGRSAGYVAVARAIGSGGSRTPFLEPVLPPEATTTACDDTGCMFNQYRQETLYASLVDGSVGVRDAAGTRSIDIALRASDTYSAALDHTISVNGTLQVTPTTVNGVVTLVTTYTDRREEPQSIRYQAVGFEPGADRSTATPVSGSISAEWTSADYETRVYTTRAATVPFP